MIWTTANSEILKRMWLEGYSAGVIAQHFGITKSSVDGRLKRMKLRRQGEVSKCLPTHPGHVPGQPREMRRIPQEDRLWGLDEDERRVQFARRAAKGARMALEAANG